MKTRWTEIIIIVLALGVLSYCFAAWNVNKPADSDGVYTWPTSIRANWDALEAALGTGLTNYANAGIRDPRDYGAVGNGTTNDYAAFVSLIAAYSAGDEIILAEGKNYLLNSAASIDFTKKCIISGLGTITVGTTVGERSAIMLSAAGTIVRDITIVGDITTWANTPATYYVSLGIFANDITIDNVKINNSIFAIKGSGYDNIKIINSSITTTLDVDSPGTARYAAGIYLVADCENVLIRGNYFSGYGQAIESGYRNKSWIIADNTFEKQGDNGTYLTGSGYTITGNVFRDQLNHGVVAYAENITVNDNSFYATGTYTPNGAIRIQGMLVVAGHVADADNNTSHDIVVSGNSVMGDFSGNIIIVQPYHSEDSGVSNVTISDNIISAKATDATAVTGNRGIYVLSTNDLGSMDMITHGVSITGNVVKGCYNGIGVTTGASGAQMFANISNNVVYKPTFYSFNFQGLQKSIVKGNIATNPIGTNVSPSAFLLTNCNYNIFEGNYCGNTSGDGGQQDEAFSTGTGNTYNHFVNNRIEGIANFAGHYVLDGATDTITLDLVHSETLGGHDTFSPGEGTIFIIDPDGAARNYNPTGNFPTGYELTLINTAGGAETITFDSGTLAAAVAQNERGIFIYSGAAWVKVYVGS